MSIPIQSVPTSSTCTSTGVENNPWVKVEEVKTLKTETTKKRSPKSSRSEAPNRPMSTEPNAEKVQQLKVQIALLQRELARETQISSDVEDK